MTQRLDCTGTPAGTLTVPDDKGNQVTLPYNATAKQIHEASRSGGQTYETPRRPTMTVPRPLTLDTERTLTAAILGMHLNPDARILAQQIMKEVHRMGYTIEIRHCESHA